MAKKPTVASLAADVATLRDLMENIASQLVTKPVAAPVAAPKPVAKPRDAAYSSKAARLAERTRLKALLGLGPNELPGTTIKQLRAMVVED